MEEHLSLAWLEQHRLPMSGLYAFRPGDIFPLEVPDILGSGSLRFYVKVGLDEAVRDRDRYRRSADAFKKVVSALDSPAERAAWIRSKPRSATLLFFLLDYDATAHYEVDPRRSMGYEYFLTNVLRLGGVLDSGALEDVHRWFFRDTDAFAESIGYKLVGIEEGEQFYEVAIWPTVTAYAIIMRELTIFVLGGEVIRAGAWLIEWARNLRAMVAAVEALLAFTARNRAAATVVVYLDEMLETARVLGGAAMELLNVKYVHDVLLEVVPDLVKVEQSVATFLEAQQALQDSDGDALAGWVLDNDPIDAAIMPMVVRTIEQANR